MASGGEINNDGFLEFAGVPPGFEGPVPIYSGYNGSFIANVPTYPFQEPIWTTRSVAFPGDLNADGLGDLVSGVPMDEGDYIGLSPGTVAAVSGSNLGFLWGKQSFDTPGLGGVVRPVGDINKDGFNDVIVGMGSFSATVFVYSGKNGNIIYTLTGDGGPYGKAVDGIGDVDGDSFPDFIVGNAYGGTGFGKLYQYTGRTGGLVRTFQGDAQTKTLGYSVAGIGDVNGDGIPDYAAGAPAFNSNPAIAGRVVVYSGSNGTVLYTFQGNSAGDYFGYSIAGPGDINSDGTADLAVGAPFDITTLPAGGMIRIFSGANGSILASLYGDKYGSSIGYSLAAAGDMNADGYPDLVAGAPYDPSGGTFYNSPVGSVVVISFTPGLLQYGAGTPGCAGPHIINATRAPKINNPNFALTGTAAPAGSLGLCLVTDVAYPSGYDAFGLGFQVLLDLTNSTELYVFDAASDATGYGTAAAPIPNDPTLVGRHYYGQLIWYFPAGSCTPNPSPFGLTSSEGLDLLLML